MEKFTGFPEGNAGQIPIPIVFFHQLLPSITDPGELKLTIYTFYLFERTEGAFRYLRRADYCNDDLFMNRLSNDHDQAERILDLSLDLAQQRGTLLLTEMVIGSGKENLYFLNSPRDRAAVKAIQNGQWTSGALAEPKTEVHTPNIFQLYEEHIGPLSPLIAEELGEAQDTYPAEWISDMVTKSGGNRFAGTAYAFLRDTSLDANSYFNELNNLPKEILERKQFGASIGGPIKRNRAFFFFNYDGTRRLQETSQQILVPTESLRNGVFRFVTQACPGQTTSQNRPTCVDASGNPLVPVSSYSLVANDPRALGVSQTIQKETFAYQPLPNDFTAGDGLNYANYRWNSPTEEPVDSVTTRIDVQINSRQSVFGRYSNAWRNEPGGRDAGR